MRVAFVVCPAYHGATLLALLLNNHSEISALGDTLPLRGVDQSCACGLTVERCGFWQSVAATVPSPQPDGHLLLPALPRPLARRHVEGSVLRISGDPRLNHAVGRLAGRVVDVLAPAAWRLRPREVGTFVESCRSFYAHVLELQGTTLFVDGYKSWRRAALLARTLQRDADVRIVHLVRDPRGFAASRRRHHGGDLRDPAWLWSALHERMQSLRKLAPYHVVRYEDLCRSPDSELRSLLEFLEVPQEPLVRAPSDPRKHHLIGNRMLETFTGDVTLDTRWREVLTAAEQLTVLRCAGSLAQRLGYGREEPAPAEVPSFVEADADSALRREAEAQGTAARAPASG